jgi:hypothetical protein
MQKVVLHHPCSTRFWGRTNSLPALTVFPDDLNYLVLEFLAGARRALCQALGYLLPEFILFQALEFCQAVVANQILCKDQIPAKPLEMPLAKNALKTSISHTNAEAFHGCLHF